MRIDLKKGGFISIPFDRVLPLIERPLEILHRLSLGPPERYVITVVKIGPRVCPLSQ